MKRDIKLTRDVCLTVERNHYYYGLGVNAFINEGVWEVNVRLVLWTVSINNFNQIPF